MWRVTIAGVHAREARAGPSLLQTEERGLRRSPFSQTASHAAFTKLSGTYRHRDSRNKPARATGREGGFPPGGCTSDSPCWQWKAAVVGLLAGSVLIRLGGRARRVPQGPGFCPPWALSGRCLGDLPRLLLGEGSAQGGRGGPASARPVLLTFPPRSPGKPRVPTLREAGRSLRTPHLSGSLTTGR